MVQGNHAEFEGYMPFVPKVRQLTTSKVCGFALKNKHEIKGEERTTGTNCVAYGDICDEIAQARTSDLVTAKGYLVKQKIYPIVHNTAGKELYETVLHVEEFTINGKTIRHEKTAGGADLGLPFDL
jgi:hypothetical protein